MQKEISSPFGGSDVVTIATGLRSALKDGAKKAPVSQEVTFIEPGDAVVFRVSDGIIMATGGQFTAMTNAQNVDVVEDIIKAFETRGVTAGRIDLLIQHLTPRASDVLMGRALRANVRSVMAIYGIGNGPPSGRGPKHVMVKRGA